MNLNLALPILRDKFKDMYNEPCNKDIIIDIVAKHIEVTAENTAIVHKKSLKGSGDGISIVNIDLYVSSWSELATIVGRFRDARVLIIQCMIIAGNLLSFTSFLAAVENICFMAIIIDAEYLTLNVETIVFLRNWETKIGNENCLHVFYQGTYNNQIKNIILQEQKQDGNLLMLGLGT